VDMSKNTIEFLTTVIEKNYEDYLKRKDNSEKQEL